MAICIVNCIWLSNKVRKQIVFELLWNKVLFLFCGGCFKTGSHCVAPAELKLAIFLPQPLECWLCRHVLSNLENTVFCFLFFFGGPAVCTEGFMLTEKCSPTWAILPAHFALVVLEMGSCELFAGFVLKPWSSTLKQLGLQAWATNAWQECVLIFTFYMYLENSHCL
jgi:hypothetical protein